MNELQCFAQGENGVSALLQEDAQVLRSNPAVITLFQIYFLGQNKFVKKLVGGSQCYRIVIVYYANNSRVRPKLHSTSIHPKGIVPPPECIFMFHQIVCKACKFTIKQILVHFKLKSTERRARANRIP